MSDDHTDYNGIYPKDPEPEAVEDLPSDEPVVVEETPAKKPVKKSPAKKAEPVVEKPSVFVRANIDDGGQLRVRETPDGEILTLVTNIPLLKVLNDDNPEWTLVEFEEAGETVTGYIKKTFLVEV